MKIKILIPSLVLGGAERACMNLASFLSSCGHEVEMQICSRKKAFYKLKNNIHLSVMPFIGFTRLSFATCWLYSVYWLFFPRKKPDLVISFLWLTNNFAAVLQKITGVPVILAIRNNPRQHFPPDMLLKECRKNFRYASKIVTLADGASVYMQKAFSLQKEQLCVIHNPVHPLSADDGIRPANTPGHYLLAVGRLAPQKGYPRMLRIFAEVHKLFPDEKLVICGEGPSRKHVESIIQDLSLTDSVILTGACKNIGAWYRHADALIHTSHYEGQPNVLLEAQSCGCPVIAFACDYGPSYLILHQKTGLVIPNGDEGAMVKAVIHYLNHPERKQEFQKNMPEHIKQFAPEKIYPQWNELIHKIINERDNHISHPQRESKK